MRAPALILILGILMALAIFALQAKALWFTQDDAFISYRYARNALDGHGLVFNTGERVEGYTNFLWVIWLVLAGGFGVGFDLAAKVLGLLSGAGIIVLAALLAREGWTRVAGVSHNAHWAGVFAALLLGSNGSFAYWSVSGLETAFFGLWVTAAIWWWLRSSRLVIPALALAVLSRPEGGLVWLVLVGAEWWLGDGRRRALILLASVALLLAPFAVFKLVYYGSLLPNPFYAKTGLSWEYVASGLTYSWSFLRDYGLWGVILLPLGVVLVAGERRWRAVSLLWLVFALYVTIVGGDVLRPHRFFMPVIAVFAVAAVTGLGWMAGRVVRGNARVWITAPLIAGWCVLGWWLPRAVLNSTRGLELGLVNKMSIVASKLRAYDSTPFSLAASTIGKIGYDLPGHRVIDMLGLTDSTVARHPETIPGNVSSWKERNFNATYVLSQDPDYILFSTGQKPSAPAERALVLHEKFRSNYHLTLYPIPGRHLAVHKRKGEYQRPDSVWPTIELAHGVNAVFNCLVRRELDSAIVQMLRLKAQGPRDYSLFDSFVADRYCEEKKYDLALVYADSALATDSCDVTGWYVRATISRIRGDTLSERLARNRIAHLSPALLSALSY